MASLVENMVKKNRSCFAITVLLTTVLRSFYFLGWVSILSHCQPSFQLLLRSQIILLTKPSVSIDVQLIVLQIADCGTDCDVHGMYTYITR